MFVKFNFGYYDIETVFYLLQVALICILSQIGSFVPAASATLGLLDAVFTRYTVWGDVYNIYNMWCM